MAEKLILDAKETAWAVEQAILNLLELVDSTAQEGDREGLRDEAKRIVLMLIAEIILADGQCEPGEHVFLRHLVDFGGGKSEARCLVESSGLWTAASEVVPDFFRSAVRCDSEVARSILREIQYIGNNVAISDCDFQARERKSVRKYVAFLESFIESGKCCIE